MNLALQVPHPFEQFTVRLPDLANSPLRLSRALKRSFGFQLRVSSRVHCPIHIVLGDQDASPTTARVLHRL